MLDKIKEYISTALEKLKGSGSYGAEYHSSEKASTVKVNIKKPWIIWPYYRAAVEDIMMAGYEERLINAYNNAKKEGKEKEFKEKLKRCLEEERNKQLAWLNYEEFRRLGLL
jgi:hypothetical protein